MRKILTIGLLLIGQLCFANMASPIQQGTLASSAFSSRDVDIIKEKLHITIDNDFKTAFYAIEYRISTDTDGNQIPLLFLAKDYKAGFKVWVDGHETNLLDIPSNFITTRHTPFEKFSNSFQPSSIDANPENATIYWEENSGVVYVLSDLKYFETNLTKGNHIIRVEYTANVWINISDWVKEYSFRYSLSPAKNWKSFGSLEITLDASAFNSTITTNIGQPASGKVDSIAVWNFQKLPGDYFQITHVPVVSSLAKIMMAIGPTGLTILLALIIIWLHFLSIKIFRKRKPTRKYSWVVIVGSVIIPFLTLIGYMISFGLIDLAIGPEAGNYHGYTFLVIILYPILLPIYWLLMWWADRTIKGRLNKTR